MIKRKFFLKTICGISPIRNRKIIQCLSNWHGTQLGMPAVLWMMRIITPDDTMKTAKTPRQIEIMNYNNNNKQWSFASGVLWHPANCLSRIISQMRMTFYNEWLWSNLFGWRGSGVCNAFDAFEDYFFLQKKKQQPKNVVELMIPWRDLPNYSLTSRCPPNVLYFYFIFMFTNGKTINRTLPKWTFLWHIRMFLSWVSSHTRIVEKRQGVKKKQKNK